MTRSKRTEDAFPLKTEVAKLLKDSNCPDACARITGKGHEKTLRPGRPFCRVTELRCGTSDAVIGVKVIHRRPMGLQELHVHTNKPHEMLKYLSVALIA